MNIFKKSEDKNGNKENQNTNKSQENDIIGTCEVCKQPIYANDKYKTIVFNNSKHLVHIKCFRKAKKEAWNYINSGNIPRL